MGVVYHGNYFAWFEVGRVELLRQAGWSYKTLEGDGLSLPVIEATCQYRHPARYDDELEIRTVGRMASAVRVEFTYELVRMADARVLATARTLHVPSPGMGGHAASRDVEGDFRVKALVTGAAGFIGSTLTTGSWPRAPRWSDRPLHRLLPAVAEGTQPHHGRATQRTSGSWTLTCWTWIWTPARRHHPYLPSRGAGRGTQELGPRLQRLRQQQHRGDPAAARGV